MFIVGLTGGIGSGKSAVTELLQSHGITVVDADIVARQAVAAGSPALDKIIQHFGPEIVDSNKALDRAKLRAIIFSEPAEKQWLESLLHPLIREMIVSQLSTAKSEYAVLVSPLLFETDQHLLTHYTVVVDVPEAVQIQRTTQRDNNSVAQVKAIIAAQLSRADRVKQADAVILNNSNLACLQEKTATLHQELLSLARQHYDKTED